MRKYQQLLLLIISCISIGILFMYKTENNRLKDVLQVINFFGRNDAAIFKKIDANTTINDISDYLHPLAVWQSIGDNFHGYSAYWWRNELVAGGEASVIVVGRKRAVLNYMCSLYFKNKSINIQGKFRFQRMDNEGDDDNYDFTRYNFFCRLNRDFGTPESVIFNDLTSHSKDGHSLKLRSIKVVKDVSKEAALQPLTVCVNLVNRDSQNVVIPEMELHDLLEFFIHHYALGIEDFVIYNGDDLPQTLLPILRRFNIRVHLIPFNFPFSTENASHQIRSLIEEDCLLRSANRARYCLVLAFNEFFYPNSKLDDPKSVVRALDQIKSNKVYRFDLPVFAVCKNQKHKYLFENNLYDPEIKSHKVSICRPPDSGLFLNFEQLSSTSNQIALHLSEIQVFTLRYVDCIQVGKDGLHDWQNSLREDFMLHILRHNEEIKALI